ncbi:MAG: hypothetical protein J6V42_06895 [Clostridia bacterium]|nr:hypothetical protein [Clostridia bacterium]
MKKIIAIILAALVFAGAGTGVAFAIIGNRPQNVAMTAIINAVEEIAERDEVAPIYNMLKQGSLTMSVDKITMNDEDVLDGANFSGKMYFSKNAFMLEDAKVNYGDIKINADLYLSEDFVYVSEEEIFDAAYGIKFSDLAEELKNSIFAYGSGSEYAIPDEEIYNQVIDVLEALEELEASEMKKDAEKLIKKLTKEVWKIACDNFEFESEKDEVRINGEKQKVRVISIVIDGKSAANFVSDLYDFIAKDDSIVKFLEKYEDQFPTQFMSDEDKSVVELYEEFIDSLDETIDDTCDGIEAMITEDIVINVMTPKNSKTLAKLEVKVDKTTLFAIDIGKDGMKKTDKITISAAGEKLLTYEVKENSNKSFVAEISAMGGATLKINLDKKSDEFTLTAKAGETTAKITGELVSKFGKTTITVDKITAGDTVIKCDVELIIDEKDKIPAAPKKYDKISDIKDEDIEAWMEKLAELGAGAEEE